MKTSLVIMAAGIGSRFGEGIKQLSSVGPNGEIIMDYSVHDAIEAGFDKIIFIIRKDIEEDFREVIGNRMEKICTPLHVEVDYAFQDLNDLPDGFSLPEGRTKPWGTGQAVLAARDLVKEPFAVINADDYYGKEAFRQVHDFLIKGHDDFCMAGFILKNTLSDNGSVTRGVCHMENGLLTDVEETHNIVKTADGAKADGRPLDVNSLVSMNFWGFTPDFMNSLQKGFVEFLESGEMKENPLKAEYLIPIYIGELLKKGKVKVEVLKSCDTWYGMTYKADVAPVQASFRKMIADGVYKSDLYADLTR